MWFTTWSFFALLTATFALPNSRPRSLVVYHGLGDSHASPGMLEFMQLIRDKHPGIFIHSVYIEEDLDADRKAGFYGDVNLQIASVAKQLADLPELAGGFDAIGFSQGGQFLRAYVERFNDPPIRNLLTFGAQHMGIADIPVCKPYDFLCQVARKSVKASVYSAWAQKNLVQAQYYRDPTNMREYRAMNTFLTSINNELPESRNATYASNLASLDSLVLVMFTDDKTVVPKESAWFGAIHEDGEDEGFALDSVAQNILSSDLDIVPMRHQSLYKEDWIGIRTLDEAGSVIFRACQGEHMQLNDCWEEIVEGYIGEVV